MKASTAEHEENLSPIEQLGQIWDIEISYFDHKHKNYQSLPTKVLEDSLAKPTKLYYNMFY
jgi:hypothetical protein